MSRASWRRTIVRERKEAARTEAPQERIDRQVNARAERVARAPKPAPVPKSDPAPAPAPAPTPAPVSVAGMLADLDKELRSNVAAPCQAYAEMRDDLAQRYLAECKKEEEKGVQAGNLDLVLLWQAEARALTGGRRSEGRFWCSSPGECPAQGMAHAHGSSFGRVGSDAERVFGAVFRTGERCGLGGSQGNAGSPRRAGGQV
jgi:hypothetical protein